MPADKQSALAALDEAFADAIKSASGALYMSMAGKAFALPRELEEAEQALRRATEVDNHMRKLIEKVFGE